MATSARTCLRCGSVNRGLLAGKWVAPEYEPSQFEHGDVKVARSYCTIGEKVFPLFLVERVIIRARGDRPVRSLTDPSLRMFAGEFMFVIGSTALIMGFVERSAVTSLVGLLLTACSLALMYHYMRPVRKLYMVEMQDAVGGCVTALPWTPAANEAGRVAAAIAAGAGLGTVGLPLRERHVGDLSVSEVVERLSRPVVPLSGDRRRWAWGGVAIAVLGVFVAASFRFMDSDSTPSGIPESDEMAIRLDEGDLAEIDGEPGGWITLRGSEQDPTDQTSPTIATTCYTSSTGTAVLTFSPRALRLKETKKGSEWTITVHASPTALKVLQAEFAAPGSVAGTALCSPPVMLY